MQLPSDAQRSRSPTPEPVINDVIKEICSRWSIRDVHQALPNSLSYKHTADIEIWGEEFLVLLLDLASLTEGKLDEVQKKIQGRIESGRNTKLNRDTCTTRGDILALIKHYDQEDPDADEDYMPPVPKKERRYNR